MFKHLLFTSLLILSFSFVQAQKTDTASIPDNLLHTFEYHYPNAENIHWYSGFGSFQADFYYYSGNVYMEVVYISGHDSISIIRKDSVALPKAVLASLHTYFPKTSLPSWQALCCAGGIYSYKAHFNYNYIETSMPQNLPDLSRRMLLIEQIKYYYYKVPVLELNADSSGYVTAKRSTPFIHKSIDTLANCEIEIDATGKILTGEINIKDSLTECKLILDSLSAINKITLNVTDKKTYISADFFIPGGIPLDGWGYIEDTNFLPKNIQAYKNLHFPKCKYKANSLTFNKNFSVNSIYTELMRNDGLTTVIHFDNAGKILAGPGKFAPSPSW